MPTWRFGTASSFEVHAYHLEFHMHVAECSRSKALMQTFERNQVLIFNWLFDVAGVE
jgi:hypothetical protein